MAAKRPQNEIVIPYEPTELLRDEIHPKLETHRFSVIVAHRRFGKTVGNINHTNKMAIKNDLPSPRYAYIAPYRNQAKQIAWEYLKFYTHVIPGIKVNESELYVEFPSKHAGASGARIMIIGADHPDALRGSYFDGVVLDEYAQIKKELWSEVIRPALSDRKGWAVFVGTPKGQNAFYDIYQKACKDDTWYCCLYRADESGLFAEGGRYGPEELELMKKDMSEEAIRQELYCDFTASAYNIVIPIDLVTAAVNRHVDLSVLAASVKVMGVDVARFGDDRSVIAKRQGQALLPLKVYTNLDTMTLAAIIIDEINTWHPDAVFVDAGSAGGGVVDRCHQLGYDIVMEIDFGQAPLDKRYLNKRAEMYFDFKKWLEAGGSLPDDAELKTELSTPTYTYNTGNEKIKIEPKEKIKDKLGKSPDLADAAVLTVAMPVVPQSVRELTGNDCNTEYNPFD